jgi:hypothetical protein
MPSSCTRSLAAFTIGYSVMSSPIARVDGSQRPGELADRARDWRDEACGRTLRVIFEGYGSRRRTVGATGISGPQFGWQGPESAQATVVSVSFGKETGMAGKKKGKKDKKGK